MAIRPTDTDAINYSSPDSLGNPGKDERLDFKDNKGNTCASIISNADGSIVLIVGGVKVYRALLTQNGGDDPVVTVLENSLGGELVWTRLDVGLYSADLAGAFLEDKTFILHPGSIRNFVAGGIGSSDSIADLTTGVAVAGRRSDDSITLITAVNGEAADSELHATSFEVRVYP